MEKHYLSHEKDNLPRKKPRKLRPKLKKNGQPYAKKKTVPCPKCGKIFTSSNLKKSHIQSHESEKHFKCPVCPLKYKGVRNLKLHIVRFHPENYESPNIYVCTECKTKFCSIVELRSHLEEMHKENSGTGNINRENS